MDVDPMSAEIFIKNEGSAENANEMLNKTFKESIDRIKVTSGGKKIKQKGGAYFLVTYFQIFVFFLLAIASVESGIANDRLEEFKKQTYKGKSAYPPVEPPPIDDYKSLGWIWGTYDLTRAQRTAYSEDVAQYNEGRRIVDEAAEESRLYADQERARMKLAEEASQRANMDSETARIGAVAARTNADAQLTEAQERVFSAGVLGDIITRFDSQITRTYTVHDMNQQLNDEKAILQETLTYFAIFGGIFFGFGMAVGIYYFVKYFNKGPVPVPQEEETRELVDITPFQQLFPDLVEEYIKTGEVLEAVQGEEEDELLYTYWTVPKISNLLNSLARRQFGPNGRRLTAQNLAAAGRREIGNDARSVVSTLTVDSFNDDNTADTESFYTAISRQNHRVVNRGAVPGKPNVGGAVARGSSAVGRVPSSSAASLLAMKSAPASNLIQRQPSRTSTGTVLDPNRPSARGSQSSASTSTGLQRFTSTGTWVDPNRPSFGRGGRTVKKRKTRKSRKRIRKSNKKSKRRN